jgi:arsenate reductase
MPETSAGSAGALSTPSPDTKSFRLTPRTGPKKYALYPSGNIKTHCCRHGAGNLCLHIFFFRRLEYMPIIAGNQSSLRTVIYHNPNCSKSRQTLALLEERGLKPDVIEYLKTPPDAATLGNILQQLGMTALEFMRKGEDEYKAAQVELHNMSDAEQIAWLTKHPRVIERPVVVTAKGARIGRPPEQVLEILD